MNEWINEWMIFEMWKTTEFDSLEHCTHTHTHKILMRIGHWNYYYYYSMKLYISIIFFFFLVFWLQTCWCDPHDDHFLNKFQILLYFSIVLLLILFFFKNNSINLHSQSLLILSFENLCRTNSTIITIIMFNRNNDV